MQPQPPPPQPQPPPPPPQPQPPHQPPHPGAAAAAALTNGMAIRFRWGFAAIAAAAFVILFVLVLLVDEIDSGLGGWNGLTGSPLGSPLAHSQLPPLSSSRFVPASDSVRGAESQSSLASWWTPLLDPLPAKEPLALLIASRFGVANNLSATSAAHMDASADQLVPPRSQHLLPLHTSLNSSVHTRMSVAVPGSVTLAAVHTHTPAAAAATTTAPANRQPPRHHALVQIWTRSSRLLLPSTIPLWRNDPFVLKDSWKMNLEFKLEGSIDRWDWDADQRRMVFAHSLERGSNVPIITLITLDASWTSIEQQSNCSLSLWQGKVSALALSRGHVVFSLDHMGSAFEAISVNDGLLVCNPVSDGHFSAPPLENGSLSRYQRTAALLKLPGHDSGTLDRVLVVQFLSDSLRYSYIVRVYEKIHSGASEWAIVGTVSGKPFANAEVHVRFPDPLPASNLIFTHPLEASEAIGIASTPFIMTIDARVDFRSHQSIKIVNLDDRVQFLHMALDRNGQFMALVDNTNGVVILEKAAEESTPLEWEVVMEFALPFYMRSLRVLSLGLVRPFDEEESSLLLVILLESGVITSFDISQQPHLDDMSPLFDWHLEIILALVSMLAYVMLARLARNNMARQP